MIFFNELKNELNETQIMNFELYYELLIQWNEKINLTTIIEKNDVYLKHFYDSLLIRNNHFLKEANVIADLGSGAGFPGIPLAIYFPKKNFTLIEPTKKRCIFLEEVINKLELKNVKVINDRMENVEEKFNFIVTRAVAKSAIILELSAQALCENGYLCMMKAKTADEELIQSKNAMKVLHFEFKLMEEHQLPVENSIRKNMYFKKIDITSQKYPRDFGQIKKKSL